MKPGPGKCDLSLRMDLRKWRVIKEAIPLNMAATQLWKKPR